MPVYPGALSRFSYILEDFLGAPLPENPAFKSIITDSFDPGIDPALIKRRGCGSRDLVGIKRGVLKPDFKVSFAVPADDIMNFIHHVVDCYAMTISALDEGPEELIEILYRGVRIDKATISCSLEDVLKADCDLMAQDVNSASAKIAGANYTDIGGEVSWADITVQKGQC
jgi:hypothetical protein